MESVMDLWRLVEEPQEFSHMMTPSGDAPEHSTKSPIFCNRYDSSEEITPPDKWCHVIPRVKDNWVGEIQVEQCRGPKTEFNDPEETWKENDMLPAEISNRKSEEVATGSNEVIRNMPTTLTLGSEEAVSQQKRRETLFQIERLLLRARPYDSIGFFYVQRELFHYLEVNEFEDSASFTRLH